MALGGSGWPGHTVLWPLWDSGAGLLFCASLHGPDWKQQQWAAASLQLAQHTLKPW